MDPVHSLADATAAASSSSPSMLATVRDEDGCNPIESAAPTPGVVADTVKSTSPSPPAAKVDESLVRHAMYSPTSPRLMHSGSPPPRKDTLSSISTQATTATTASAETNNTSYSADTSPSLHQSIFSVKDGSDVSNTRRASRRRTGPLSQQSRERAALIRKLGACHDCRRRRVACHPSHHNMTWEDLLHRFHRSQSPNSQDVTPSFGAGRPLSPASSLSTIQPTFAHETQEMDIDSSPTAYHQPGRHPLSEARIRTPLPSGPRLEKSLSLPGIESLKNELQHNVPKILSTTHRGRYNSVQVLLLFWHDDEDATTIQDAVRELAHVFDRSYHYTFHIQAIPSASDSSKSSWRWLSRRLNDFAEDCDQRDVLKIVYYAGHTCLDGNREMILTSSMDKDQASTIRWSGMQQILEEACADVLILMDAAYYPSSKIVRRKGVLELLAASASEDHATSLGRCAFTRALSELLSARAARSAPLSVVELHALLLSHYPKIVRDTTPERETLTTFPVPLHTMMSGNSRLPSVFLSPIHHPSPTRNSFSYENNPQLHLSIRLTDDNVDIESWNEWLRLMPEGVKDVKIDGPFRPSFRPG
ncbi:tyrosine-protein phosphatase non-receptor type 6 [Metarhizium guizhouense ARSEF 977]|uniref:Tyrosine-protein phosphatase non-receptor type 6 n=1 Tax=Metarhizium guizhouense (strain ARSEF 977) TaxID=1276136 RepID=A0A0B4I480_METGA|nr:tyrosine-protein phosphatase non-receptor type 6 [Metarhizium guizhouense ARSEF 977]